MQRLTTLLLLVGITSTVQAQTAEDFQPDANGDGCIAMSDLLSVLSVFGTCENQDFTCGDPVSYQGYAYETVLIGEQCWFAENLRSEQYLNGDAIPTNLSDSLWSSTSGGACDIYVPGESCGAPNSDFDFCDSTQVRGICGRYYNWHAVDDPRGLCPSGWRIPSIADWADLHHELGANWMAGGKMRTTEYWPIDYSWLNSNSSGFSCVPCGWKDDSGPTGGAGILAGFWATNGNGATAAWSNQTVFWDDRFDLRSNTLVSFGMSIRCIQD